MTHEEDEIRHLREQLVRFVVEQLKQSKADGTLQDPLADLRKALDSDVRRSVDQALADGGFGKGTVRLDEGSIKSIAEQLNNMFGLERAATVERNRLAVLNQPAVGIALTESASEVAVSRGDSSADFPAPLAERPEGLGRSSQRDSDRFVHSQFGMSAAMLAKIVLALALVVIALLFYISYDKLGDEAELGGAAPAVAAGATPLPESSNPFETGKEIGKGSNNSSPTPQAESTSDMPRGR